MTATQTTKIQQNILVLCTYKNCHHKKKAEIYKHNFKIVVTIYQRQEKEHKCNGIVNVLVLTIEL